MDALVQLGLGGGALGILFVLGKALLAAHLKTMDKVVGTMDSITKSQAQIVASLRENGRESRDRHTEVIQEIRRAREAG